MKTICKNVGAQTLFIISDLDSAYHDAAHDLYYGSVEEGFAKAYPSDTPYLDRIYRNFQQYAEEMILQTARVRLVPWEKALLAFLQIVGHQDINWWLTGSAALAVRGIDLTPRDLDLVVDGASAQRLGELLLDNLVEPVLPTEGWICKWFGRAFLHARIEWVGDVNSSADEPHTSDFGPTAARRLEVIDWHGKEIRIPPLALQLQVSERRGLTERVEKIKSAMHAAG